MNILIAADLVPTKSNENLFFEGNITELLGKDLEKIWNDASFRIFNLETPICSKKAPIKKVGPNLIANPNNINGIKNLNPSVVCLANNHIMDQGIQGVESTINLLNEYNLKFVGVGKNIQEAKKEYTINYNDKKIAIYALCETEFSGATDDIPGANLYNEFTIFEDIEKIKENNDYVIVLYHGGKEFYRYPSPKLQNVCRKIIDSGADLLVCQHSHCIGCYEEYKERTIVYGQGNFIFDGKNDEYWNTSLIIDFNIENMKIKYIPIVKENNTIRLAIKEEKEEILNLFKSRSENIKKDDFIKNEYKKFSNEYFDHYIQKCHGDNIVFRILNKICMHKLTRKMYSKQSLLNLLNVIECEAHRELFIEGLKQKIYDVKK